MEINIRTVLPYVALAGILFFLAGAIGYAHGVYNPESAQKTLENFKENQSNPIHKLPRIGQMFAVFLSNSLVGFAIMLSGVILAEKPIKFAFGSLPALVYNGFMIGKMCSIFVAKWGAFPIFITMLPHCVFEFSAVFICAGIGLYTGRYVKKEVKADPSFSTKDVRKQSIKYYIYNILPVFFVAALVEIYISTYMISMYIVK